MAVHPHRADAEADVADQHRGEAAIVARRLRRTERLHIESCSDEEHWRTSMKTFVTGATGYIGGSIAERLVGLSHTVLGLVRSRENGLLLRERGIDLVVGTLDDWDVLTDAAHAASAIIHAASAGHPGSVLTMVGALERSAKPLIYTTGSGIVADSAGNEYASSLFSRRTPTANLFRSDGPV